MIAMTEDEAREKFPPMNWPQIEVGDRRLQLMSVNLCVDWGGRQAQCEFQDAETFQTRSATYFYLESGWNSPDWPADAPLTRAIRALFDLPNCGLAGAPDR
jgi:hypothetical protein